MLNTFENISNLPLLLLDRLRLFTVAPTVSGVWLRFLLLLFVLFSLRIDDFDNVNGGGAFVDSDVDAACDVIAVVTALTTAAAALAVAFDCATTVAICELTFHGHANGGAFDTVSYKNKQNRNDIYQFKFTHKMSDRKNEKKKIKFVWPFV